jgi:ribonuclease Z
VQITFLGTSAGVPTRNRNVSAVALRLQQRGEVWLFDCGEATQHQILKSDLKLSQITHIFITHLHGDHLFGLTGLLATCGMAGQGQRIDVYGPSGLEEYLGAANMHSQTQYSYPVEVREVRKGIVYEDDDYIVTSDLLKHRVPAYGYRVQERDRPGRFDAERAAALGVPFGPLYGRLKRGERITLQDGREIDGRDLCGATETGRSIVYCTDTIFCENAVELARDADLLIHEATFSEQDEHLARQSLHSTTSMAARVAREAQVKRLILTHFSPRYVAGNTLTPDDLLREAQATFPQTELAHDFMVVEVPRRSSANSSPKV